MTDANEGGAAADSDVHGDRDRDGDGDRGRDGDGDADGFDTPRRTRVKVCGVTNAADRDAAVDAGADAVGLIAGVTVDTPREIGLDEAADLAAGVPPLCTSVLVTMPGDAATACERIEAVEPDVVQLHGVAPDEVAKLADARARVVVAVDAAADAPVLAAYAEVADALLVDSVDDDGGGGTGETHDWTRTRDRVSELDVPVILAGGLTPDNVADAVATVDPFAVDVATGVERDGGKKDHDDVRRFVRNATRAAVGTATASEETSGEETSGEEPASDDAPGDEVRPV